MVSLYKMQQLIFYYYLLFYTQMSSIWRKKADSNFKYRGKIIFHSAATDAPAIPRFTTRWHQTAHTGHFNSRLKMHHHVRSALWWQAVV